MMPFCKKSAFLTILCLSLWACEDCLFTSKNSAEMAVKFFVTETEATLTFDSVKTSAGGHVYFQLQTDEQGFYLPEPEIQGTSFQLMLNPTRDTSAFYFYWEDRVDTLSVMYERQIAVVTPDCGFDQRIDNLEIINHTFLVDSIFVIKPHLEINDDNNIEIYLSE